IPDGLCSSIPFSVSTSTFTSAIYTLSLHDALPISAQFDGTLLSSRFPRMDDPAVAIDVYRGDAGLDTGRPQSVFALEPDLIESRSEEHTSELQSRFDLVCRLLLEKKKSRLCMYAY